MGGTAVVVGDGVVQIATDGGAVAAGCPAGQIAAADEVGQRPRWCVTGLGNGAHRRDHRQMFCRRGEFTQHLGGDQ